MAGGRLGGGVRRRCRLEIENSPEGVRSDGGVVMVISVPYYSAVYMRCDEMMKFTSQIANSKQGVGHL